ncbi:MAG TPA: PQQ-dependent sugar dehydrogenase, partial [Thermomicrobiales bacterium]|nr:PQQ-dependent sugar dehydrogenase [Thermomicrobiales bacterium]
MSGSVFIKDTELRVSETAGTAVETIERSGSLSGDVTIHYGITADTATDGQDFVGGFGTIDMPDGVSSVQVPIQILDDSLSEPTEKFVFNLVTVDNATLFAPRTSDIYILDDENPAPPPPAEPPLVSDFDVTPVSLVTGLNQPIRMVESPIDPSIVYVAEKPGAIVTANLETGAVTPLIDLSDGVNDFGDRGMLSIALHPDFVHNPYIYATIVVDPPDGAGLTGNAGPDGGGNRYAELVRFTADASTDYTTVVPGSEVVLLGGTGQSLNDVNGGGAEDFTDPQFANETSSERYIPDGSTAPVVNGIKQDYWKVDSTSHVGGSLAFGPDGALYVGTGDGSSFDTADPRAVDIQSLDSLNGKILRIDPMTGLGLSDNPFVTDGMSLDTNAAKVFQLGLRNPFSIDFTPDGRLIMTDTGWNSWEELNSGGPGANFGWPYYEGADGGNLDKPPGYSDFASAPAFYSAVANGDITVTAPFRAFSHDSADPGFQIQAITGSEVVYTGGVYPPGLTNDYIFTDFVQGEIYTVNVNDRTDAQFLYQWPGSAPTDFIQGADGFVYYADLVNGVIGRLDIASGGPATTTIGSGPDTLVLKISEDAYQGDAQFT